MERPEVNFATLAQAYDIQSFGPVTEPGELGDALKRALRALKDTGRPVLLDVIMQNR
ncbi:MAG: hypothetical protein HYY45_12325 [Deltaproteobacteria bacterium]|nr:hypothetical protein [Deltaproteobacteria bacterium]